MEPKDLENESTFYIQILRAYTTKLYIFNLHVNQEEKNRCPLKF